MTLSKHEMRTQVASIVALAQTAGVTITKVETATARGAGARKKSRALPMRSWIVERWAVRR